MLCRSLSRLTKIHAVANDQIVQILSNNSKKKIWNLQTTSSQK